MEIHLVIDSLISIARLQAKNASVTQSSETISSELTCYIEPFLTLTQNCTLIITRSLPCHHGRQKARGF
jgi:hypothetical protein